MTITDTRRLSWDGLQDAWRRAEDAADASAVIAAMDAKEQAAKRAAERYRQQQAQWFDAAHAQYQAADAACRGHLLSPLGKRDLGSELQLWRGSDAQAAKYASEDLREWWAVNGGRLSWSRWQREQAQQARAYRDERDLDRMAQQGHGRATTDATASGPQPGHTRAPAHVAATTGPQPGAMARYIARLDELTRAANRAAQALGRIAP